MLDLDRKENFGILEYAIILVMVSIVSFLVLYAMGPTLQQGLCLISGAQTCVDTQGIRITAIHYDEATNHLSLRAVFDDGYDPNVTLTLSTGDQMIQQGNEYAVEMKGLLGCPCTIHVVSSEGESEAVVVQAD